jgi:SnoaL-like domain
MLTQEVGTVDHDAALATLKHYLDTTDPEVAHQIYHPDAVLEFPQSGERFDGVENFKPWRAKYPAQVDYEFDRMRGRDDIWVAELRGRYDGGPWHYGVSILEFRGDKVARETIYVAEGWEAPDWRAPWRSAPPIGDSR